MIHPMQYELERTFHARAKRSNASRLTPRCDVPSSAERAAHPSS
jgi:hypothetical protein